MSETRRRRVRLADEELPQRRRPGRPEGSLSRFSKEARERARETGALPHELLLAWARGEPMSRKVPPPDATDEEMRDPRAWALEYAVLEEDAIRDCAKAAAPYYAPKISTVEVVTGVSDADLDEFIARAASEAGLSVGPRGEGQEE